MASKRQLIRNASIGLVLFILAFVLSACTTASSTSLQTDNQLLSMTLKTEENISMHIHVLMAILVDGKLYQIPPDVGIEADGSARLLHTHDTTGTIHIESPVVHQFYLSDFFTIWGKPFSSSCIAEYCIDENHTIVMQVNGEPSDLFGDLPLHDDDEIIISYMSR